MLIGAEGTRLLRKSVARGDPAGAQRRGGSRTARGKRVAAAEINTNFRKGLFQCPPFCLPLFSIESKRES